MFVSIYVIIKKNNNVFRIIYMGYGNKYIIKINGVTLNLAWLFVFTVFSVAEKR